jgi:peptide/nickel transport system substrate-binding protein
MLAALLLLVAGTAGCGSGGDPLPDHRAATIVAHMSAPPASLSLIGKPDRNSEIVATQLTDSLVQFGPDLELQPRVAESWEFSEDQRTLTFSLRPDVRWHDGEPVTADDVVYTVRMARSPALENRSYLPLFEAVESVVAVDPQTVRVRYTDAHPNALEAWRIPLIPEHVASRDAGPDDSPEEILTLIQGSFAQHPIGCGPYRFVRYRPDEELVLVANEDYWDGGPATKTLIFRFFPDQRTAFQSLMTGELDVMTATTDLWMEAQQSRDKDRLEAVIYYRLSAWVLFWNQSGPPFWSDPRVRRAMVLALDRSGFNEAVLFGLALPGITTYHPKSALADPELEAWAYDPDEARRLLDEAGWRDSDGDGIRDRDGRPFRFTYLSGSTQKLVEDMAAWQQQSWREVGLAVDIERLEWQTFRERRNARQFDALAFSIGLTPDADMFELYHSSAREGGFNYMGLADPELDRLLEQVQVTFDPAERREIHRLIQRRLHEQQPVTVLFHFATPVLHDRRLIGVTPSPLDHWTTTSGPRVWRWSDEGA